MTRNTFTSGTRTTIPHGSERPSIAMGIVITLLMLLPLIPGGSWGSLAVSPDARSSTSRATDHNGMQNDFAPVVDFPATSRPAVLNNGIDSIILSCRVMDDDNTTTEGANCSLLPGFVAVDLSLLGLENNRTMLDDGLNGDLAAFDNFFSCNITVPASTPPGTYHLPIRAYDNGTDPLQRYNLTENITLNVAQYNRPPVLRPDPPTALVLVEDNGSASLSLNDTVFYDADVENGSDTLTFTLFNGSGWTASWVTTTALVSIDAQGLLAVIPEANASGQLELVLNATDITGQWITHPLNVSVLPVNDPPILNISVGELELTAWEDEWLNITYTGWDPADGTPVTFHATIGAPERTFAGTLNMSTGGNLSILPINRDVGLWWLNITLDDGLLAVWANGTVNVTNTNDPPRIISIGAIEPVNGAVTLEATQDQWLNFTIVAADDDCIHGQSLTFGSALFGDAFHIDPRNGNTSFLPTNANVGYVNGTITVTDQPDGAHDTVNLSIRVANINDPPLPISIQWPVDGMSLENLTASFSLWPLPAVTDPDSDVLNYSWNFGDGSTGYGINTTHTYAAGGSYNITLTASDGFGGSVSDSIMLTISITNVNTTTASLPSSAVCFHSYSDEQGDDLAYIKDGFSILAHRGYYPAVDILSLTSGRDGEDLMVNMTLASDISELCSYLVYFVRENYTEETMPSRSTRIPDDHVPDATASLYTATAYSSLKYTYGEAGGLGTVVVDGPTLRFRVPIRDIVSLGKVEADFGLFAKATLLNSTTLYFDSAGAGAHATPAVTSYIPSGGGDDDKNGLFGLGRVGPVDIFYIIMAGGALLLIIILVLVIGSVLKRRRTGEVEPELTLQEYTPPDEEYYTADTNKEVITDDMYQDRFSPGGTPAPGKEIPPIPDAPSLSAIPPLPGESPAQIMQPEHWLPPSPQAPAPQAPAPQAPAPQAPFPQAPAPQAPAPQAPAPQAPAPQAPAPQAPASPDGTGTETKKEGAALPWQELEPLE